MVEWLLEVAVVIGGFVQLAILYHCNHFKGQMPIVADSLKTVSDELSDNLQNALSILEDMIELLEQTDAGGNIITTPNPATGESIMNMLTNQFMSNLISPTSHAEREIQTEDEDTQTTEIGN